MHESIRSRRSAWYLALPLLGMAALWHMPVWPLAWALSHFVAITPLEGQETGPQGGILVTDDPGGPILRRLAMVERMEREGTLVAVLGACASAYTLYATLPTACTRPEALWMYHAVRLHKDRVSPTALLYGPQDDPLRLRLESAIDARTPPSLAAWRASIPFEADVWITGADLIDNGWMDACPGAPTPTHTMARARALALSWTDPPGATPTRPFPRRAPTDSPLASR